MSSSPSSTASGEASKPSGHLGWRGYRWRVCALLFFATTINYMDRSVLGVLGPTLQNKVFNWTDQDYANINIAFKLAYAIGLLSMGAFIDKLGTKLGYTVSIVVWSLFGMLHGAIQPGFGFIGFVCARFGLGFGEAGNFPAAVKTVAEWFPKKERAFATGIFNAGSNVGAILAPLVIPLFVLPDGTNWQYAFFITGGFSALWLVMWLKFYRRPQDHTKISAEELAYITADSSAETVTGKIPWSKVVRVRETWAFAAVKMPDAVWWFFLFWGGKYLADQFGLDIKALGLPLVVIYVVADIGSIGGGWLSSFFIKRGWAVNKARKSTLLLCAITVLPVALCTQIGTKFNVDEAFFTRLDSATYGTQRVVEHDGKKSKEVTRETVSPEVKAQLRALTGKSFSSAKELTTAAGKIVSPELIKKIGQPIVDSARSDNHYWIAVMLIALAAAGHQAWSANVFTLVSDVFPRKATASVIGIGGMVGALSGILADFGLGKILTGFGPGAYSVAFLIAGSMYLITLGVAHMLMPKMTPLDENLKRIEA
jgi:ACS family hexuronate transporter-like MFS transporter